jgi:DNA-binding transcriptional LysR family regulator
VNLRRLEYFVTVAKHLHFTRAADELEIAQPALSQQIRRLEGELGVQLFERTSRNVELSEFGKALLPRAHALLNQARIAKREVRALAGLERGVLRVGASGTIAAFLLPELIARYREMHPRSLLHILQRRSEGILDLLEAGDLEVGLIRLPFRHTSLQITPLITEPIYAALPLDHPLASEASIRLGQLAEDDFVMCVSQAEPFYEVVINLCAEEGFEPRVIADGAEYTTVFRLVVMGMGVSIVSGLATRHKVDPQPALVRIDGTKASSPIVMVSRRPAELSKPAGTFFEMVAQRSAEGFIG